jgi:dTDP-4-amino-4,6-dideoxygalactose transaminase
MDPKYYHPWIGGNFRLDALQAAVLAVKLPHLDAWTEQRQANAARYDQRFADAGLAGGLVGLPVRPTNDRHVCNQYVIRVPRRDALRAFLGKNQIGSEVYYPLPLHQQDCFASLGYREGAFPESERAAVETLAIPIYPELSDAQATHVVETIKRFFNP